MLAPPMRLEHALARLAILPTYLLGLCHMVAGAQVVSYVTIYQTTRRPAYYRVFRCLKSLLLAWRGLGRENSLKKVVRKC